MAAIVPSRNFEVARYHGCLGESRSQKTRWVVLILINLASLGCLVWALHDVSWGDLQDDLATIDYGWGELAGAIEFKRIHGSGDSLAPGPASSGRVGLLAGHSLHLRRTLYQRSLALSRWRSRPLLPGDPLDETSLLRVRRERPHRACFRRRSWAPVGALDFPEVRRAAQAIGICKRWARLICAGGSGGPGTGAISSPPAAICPSQARVAASFSGADGRPRAHRPFPLSVFRAERRACPTCYCK